MTKDDHKKIFYSSLLTSVFEHSELTEYSDNLHNAVFYRQFQTDKDLLLQVCVYDTPLL